MKAEASMPTRYRCVPTRHRLVNVVDLSTGRPAEVGATAILLERREARQLIAWLLARARRKGPEENAKVLPPAVQSRFTPPDPAGRSGGRGSAPC
ncbi:hypothetical protein NE852_13145 [Rhizobium sp. Pop5]|uniref:hypothetical protein n=1 Tax=Rhizobium sp. Pop5 TaxID=1223565 RepID=UPI00028398E2|nr:hypothetical protein [Rhizobium sp. Pop5]EJZ17328.1 hypothetical protein RCCGEPOP_31274 [Rhizobium sp. Pop5]UVD59070.1 hypothetical protein NE852_13145 [Rhizobium sp. Pop5]